MSGNGKLRFVELARPVAGNLCQDMGGAAVDIIAVAFGPDGLGIDSLFCKVKHVGNGRAVDDLNAGFLAWDPRTNRECLRLIQLAQR